jgi:hypothetical protein
MLRKKADPLDRSKARLWPISPGFLVCCFDEEITAACERHPKRQFPKITGRKEDL